MTQDTTFENAMMCVKENTNELSYKVGDNLGMTLDYDWYKRYWEPWTEYHPHYHYDYVIKEDKFEKAFKICKMLFEEKMLASGKLVDFMKLVEKIASYL
jgi:hypothetical protein